MLRMEAMIPGVSYNKLLDENRLMRDFLKEWVRYHHDQHFSAIPELTEKFLNETKEYEKEN